MTEESLRDAEARLQAAQLAADASALDALIDERLVFTGPDGRLYGKADELEIQRSGQQTLTSLTPEVVSVLVDGRLGVTWFLGSLAGVFRGEPFNAQVRYTRTWVHTDAAGWRLLAAHVSTV